MTDPTTETTTLNRRREFLFLYDIRMGNPNGDPDENRPRVLPDGTYYVTDVRLKRFVRDWLKSQSHDILVDIPEDGATNLAGRLKQFLSQDVKNVPEEVKGRLKAYQAFLKLRKTTDELKKSDEKLKKTTDELTKAEEKLAKAEHDDKSKLEKGITKLTEEKAKLEEGIVKHTDLKSKLELETKGNESASKILVDVVLDAFIDARLFGSSLAFKSEDWDGPSPVPKTLTGAVQINMGEVINKAESVDIAGTSVFASAEEKSQGTFTTFFGLRYGLIAFNGIANEHSAALSRLSDSDYEALLKAMWKSVSSAPSANTRSKSGQVPRLLIDITYKPQAEFQFGCLINYVSVIKNEGVRDNAIASPNDFKLDCAKLVERLKHPCVERVRVMHHDDLTLVPDLPEDWTNLDFDSFQGAEETK